MNKSYRKKDTSTDARANRGNIGIAYSFEYTRLGSSNYGGFTSAAVRGLATQYPNYFNSLNYNNFSWTNNFNFYYPF